jgi:hypothetical protein
MKDSSVVVLIPSIVHLYKHAQAALRQRLSERAAICTRDECVSIRLLVYSAIHQPLARHSSAMATALAKLRLAGCYDLTLLLRSAIALSASIIVTAHAVAQYNGVVLLRVCLVHALVQSCIVLDGAWQSLHNSDIM